jgi:hypothetical protein
MQKIEFQSPKLIEQLSRKLNCRKSNFKFNAKIECKIKQIFIDYRDLTRYYLELIVEELAQNISLIENLSMVDIIGNNNTCQILFLYYEYDYLIIFS